MNFEIPSWLTDPGPPVHAWRRQSARRIGCVRCGLIAQEGRESPGGNAYTIWRWRNLMWDSRSSTTPTCPPTYRRDNGINPTVVMRT